MPAENEDRKTVELEIVAIDVARDTLGDLATRAGFKDERILISRHGKPLVALIGMPDLERLQSLDAA